MQARLDLSDNFTGPLLRAKEAAHELNRILERDAATWEPHDWSEWD